MNGSLSGNLATMGCGVPYAIAAKFTHPTRPVIALVGDGAFQMNGMNELITISKYWKRWSDPQFVVLVLHNNDLNQVTWEQRVMQGDPRFDASPGPPQMSTMRRTRHRSACLACGSNARTRSVKHGIAR